MMNVDRNIHKSFNDVWYPLPGSQYAFMTCPVPEILFDGTRGNGKTITLLANFAQHVGKGYGEEWRGLLLRKTFKQLEKYVIPQAISFYKRAFGDRVNYNGSDHKFTWKTGEVLTLGYMDNPTTDYENFHGAQWPWIAWEELTTWPMSDGYELMKTCWRSPVLGIPKKYLATTNPMGPGHNWVKAYYQIGLTPEMGIIYNEDGLARTRIHGEIWENPYITRNDPQYLFELMRIKDPNRRKAWLEGSWDIVAGGVIDDLWDDDIHYIPPFTIPESWYVDRSFDWGSTDPFSVGWWAESDGSAVLRYDPRVKEKVLTVYPAGTLFNIAEWYGWNGEPNVGCKMSAYNVGVKIATAEANLPYYVHPGPADNQIFSKSNDVCLADDMARVGVTWTRADQSSGSRINGLELLRGRLEASLEYPLMERPGIFIFRNNKHWRRTVVSLPRDPKKYDDADTTAEDHPYDMTRYRVLDKRVEGGIVGVSGL